MRGKKPNNKAARHREIARRYARRHHDAHPLPTSPRERVLELRLRQLRHLFDHRGEPEERFRQLADTIRAEPWSWNAARIGDDVELTFEEKIRLGIRNIECFDKPKHEVAAFYGEQKRRRDAQRMRRQRAKAGAVSRAEYLAACLSRTKPWEAEGISRRTWYRRSKEGCADTVAPTQHGGTSPSPHVLAYVKRHTCATHVWRGSGLPTKQCPATSVPPPTSIMAPSS
jgi:hypothetical protein